MTNCLHSIPGNYQPRFSANIKLTSIGATNHEWFARWQRATQTISYNGTCFPSFN